jgi:hypothetical protein
MFVRDHHVGWRMWHASFDRSQATHRKCMINRRLRITAHAVPLRHASKIFHQGARQNVLE